MAFLSVLSELLRMPYQRLVTIRRTVISYISKESGYSVLKLRCLIGSFLCLLVLIYYVESTDWLRHLFIRHQQNAKLSTESSTLENQTQMSDVAIYNCTCGNAAASRGPHQKVIGFSIYGNFSQSDIVRKYLLPLKETIKSIPFIYPDWIVRIHHNLTEDDDDNSAWTIFQKTLEFGNHVDLCNVTEITKNWKMNSDIFAMTWRWLPLLDDMVDTFMSRDSDSLIVVPRELDAVREWLASDDIFHIMKDHPAHCTVKILGGMWGVKLSDDRPRIANTFKAMFATKHQPNYGYDQALLADYIWPIARTSMMAHDSYCCQDSNLSRPFPSKRNGNMFFIGGRGKVEEYLRTPCPAQCRPKHVTPEWIFC